MVQKATLSLSKSSYQRLLRDLRQLLEAGRSRADEAVARELVRTYHTLGARILHEKLTLHARYATSLVNELADELGLQPLVLRQAVHFARLYPEPPSSDSRLRWVHYRELLRVKDSPTRAWYQEQAETKGWTYRKLAQAIRENAHQNHTHRQIEGSPEVLPRPQEATYVYKAQVERVIDGDTLLLLIDLGFDVFKRQRVRLARIDTPPLKEPLGQKARHRVTEKLADVAFVVVKTNKVDLYGRYVGHIFYAPGIEDEQRVFAEGNYLNADLVAEGLAEVL